MTALGGPSAVYHLFPQVPADI